MHETQEMWVRSLDLADPLEEGMATHSSILAWRIPLIEQTGGLRSLRMQRVGQDLPTEQHEVSFSTYSVYPADCEPLKVGAIDILLTVGTSLP